MRYIPRDHVIEEIGYENYFSFLEWAFGLDFDESIKLEKIPELWNKLHPGHLIDPNDTPEKGVAMMIEKYRKSGLMSGIVSIEVKEDG